jgi:hypothetical protein
VVVVEEVIEEGKLVVLLNKIDVCGSTRTSCVRDSESGLSFFFPKLYGIGKAYEGSSLRALHR